MTRALLAGLTTTVAVVALVVFWPQAFGGWTDYLVISGQSMEPTYHEGDLVLVRHDPPYEVGDAVAFRTDRGDVIHRIVDGNAQDGFLMQGDNNENVDEWTPTPESIIGEEFVHIAGLPARVLSAPAGIPAPAIAACGTLLLFLGFDQRRRRRRHRKATNTSSSRMRRSATPTTKASTSMFHDLSTTHRAALAVVAVLAVGAAVLVPPTFSVWRSPTTADPGAQTPVAHTLGLAISGDAGGTSVVYPNGRVGPIEGVKAGEDGEVAGDEIVGGVPSDAPGLFRGLLRDLTTTVTYHGAAKEGVLGADVVLRTPEGFLTELPSMAPAPIESGTASGTIDLDLDAADDIVAGAIAATGVETSGYTITITPKVAIANAGVKLTGDQLILNVGSELVTPSGTLQTVLDRTSSSVAEARPASTVFLGLDLSVQTARIVGLAALLLLLVAAGALVAWVLSSRPVERFRILHGSHLVEVGAESNDPGTPVRVASMAELVRLAKRDQRVILHQRFAHDAHRYFVPDGDLTYEFVVAPERPALPSGRRDDVPAATDAPLLAEDDPRAAANATPTEPSRDHPQRPDNPISTVRVERFEALSQLWMKYGADSSMVTREVTDDGRSRYVLRLGHVHFEYLGESADSPLEEALHG